MAFCLLPICNSTIKEKWGIELSGWVKFGIIIVGIALLSITPKNEIVVQETKFLAPPYSTPPEALQQQSEVIVSSSFDDFSILCDPDSTSLQKHDQFEREFENQYVQWTGIVSSIMEIGSNRYALTVKHCASTFTSDITINMREEERSRLLNYREGDRVTYHAKLIRSGDILGISASDGQLIE